MSSLGIILAGGKSTRLFPATIPVSKQLLPVYDKPLIYYPLSTLMLMGIRDFVIITRKEEQELFKRLFHDHQELMGIDITFAVQDTPNGIAESFRIVDTIVPIDTSKYEKTVLILGDNIFYGSYMSKFFEDMHNQPEASIILKEMPAKDAHRFGVAMFDENNKMTHIVEKPAPTPYIKRGDKVSMVTGLYSLPSDVYDLVWEIKPSDRGELEITDLLNLYIQQGRISHSNMLRGMILYDTGTPHSLTDATNFIRGLQDQGTMVGSPHEIAFDKGWINRNQMEKVSDLYGNSDYGLYLRELLWKP